MPERSLELRLAEPSDAAAIAALSRDLVEHGLGWQYRSQAVRQLIADRGSVVLVACQAGRLLGFAVMEFGDERAHLVLLAVRPETQRQGVGRRLLDWLVASALTAGIASIHLELRAGNAAARAFYRALGFGETLLVPGYYAGREAALRMVRLLGQPVALPVIDLSRLLARRPAGTSGQRTRRAGKKKDASS